MNFSSRQDKWLTPLLNGEIRSCFAMTEPQVRRICEQKGQKEGQTRTERRTDIRMDRKEDRGTDKDREKDRYWTDRHAGR